MTGAEERRLMRRTPYLALCFVIVLAAFASVVTAQPASRVATIEVKGMV